MKKQELEQKIRYRTYKKGKEISNDRALIKAIIAFVEVYRCIFPNASNPRIEIRVHSPETGQSLLYEIDTKYKRHIISSIEWDYTRIVAKNDVVKNINNISSVVFFCKGIYIRYREYTIYSNPDVPWDCHDFTKIEWNKIRRRNNEST